MLSRASLRVYFLLCYGFPLFYFGHFGWYSSVSFLVKVICVSKSFTY